MCVNCGPGEEDLRHDDLVVPQGTDRSWQWPLRDAAGQPLVSTSGWTARAQARPSEDSEEVLWTWTTDQPPRADASAIVFASSSVSMVFDKDANSAWDWDYAVYDLFVTTAAGKTDRISQGQITVDRSVTR